MKQFNAVPLRAVGALAAIVATVVVASVFDDAATARRDAERLAQDAEQRMSAEFHAHTLVRSVADLFPAHR